MRPIARSDLACILAPLAVFAAGLALAGDDLYDEKKDVFTSDVPKIEVVRPDAEWRFVNLDVQRQDEMARRPEAARDFQNLVARLYHPATKAAVSIFAFKFEIAKPDMAKIAEAALEDVKKRKDWKLAEQTRGAIGGRDAVKTDYYASVETAQGGALAGDVYFYSRIDAVEPDIGESLVIVFEVPKDRLKTALPGWKKILKKLKLA
jgi:hypothetical protein